MPPGCLGSVVAFVHSRVDGDARVHDAVVAKLRALGARPVARISKEVTHVIFQRKLHPTQQERAAECADLRGIHDRVAKVTPCELRATFCRGRLGLSAPLDPWRP